MFVLRTFGCHTNGNEGSSARVSRFTIGLIVNPLAGIGGRLGLKGSDGATIVQAALERGARPEAEEKAARALRALRGGALPVLTGSGPLGENSCRLAALPCQVVAHGPWQGDGADTDRLARLLLQQEPDLLLFAGGDGTARLIAAAGSPIPLLGIPAGVKMYSGVFAQTPAEAGLAAARYGAASPEARRLREVEILDLDEGARREGIAAQTLFALVSTPASAAVPAAKAAHALQDDAEIAALAAALAGELRAHPLVVLGPGSSLMRVKRALGIGGTLLGIDAVSHGSLVAADADEATLLALAASHGPPRVVVGVLGGSGAVFGRGNQPIGAALLRQSGKADVTIIGGAAKLAALGHLFVDTGDEALDQNLAGYWRVRTGPRRDTVMRVSAGEA